MVASGMLPVRNQRGYISSPWASRGQTHKAALQASMNAWQPWSSSTSAALQLKYTFLMGLFQTVSLGGMMDLCLLYYGCAMGLCLFYCGSTLCLHLPNGGCMFDFCLFDGLSSLGLISACGNVGILHQLSSVGVQGGLSH